jgi:hypothetical protein
MTTEKLKQATDLKAKIDALKDHRDDIHNIATKQRWADNNTDAEMEGCEIDMVRYGSDWSNKRLRRTFLPLNMKDMITLYLQRVDNEITRLEAEFKALGAE